MVRLSRLPLLAAILATGCAGGRPAQREDRTDINVPAESLVLFSGVDVHYYEVAGETSGELRHQMDATGPITEAGKHYDGHASWHLDWHFPFRHSVEGCSVGPVQITVTIRYDLPRWSNEGGADARLREKWSRYIEALVTHENGHRDHGLDAAREVGSTLPHLPTLPSCEEAAAAANAEAHQIVQRYKAADASYDASTRHGATQGATFR